MSSIQRLLILLGLLFFSGCVSSSANERSDLIRRLRRDMTEQTGFIKIHAAEALIQHGYRREVFAHLSSELPSAAYPYRIGVQRTLAAASTDDEFRQQMIGSIRAYAMEPSSAFRSHAWESLAKLGAMSAADEQPIRDYLSTANEADAVFGQWQIAMLRPDEGIAMLTLSLRSTDPIARLRAAVALSRLERLPKEAVDAIKEAVGREQPDSPAHVYLLCALSKHAPQLGQAEFRWLLGYLGSSRPNAVLEAGRAIGLLGDSSQAPRLRASLAAHEADARIGAADGLLLVLRGQKRMMSGLDWSIVISFLVIMLLIGVYYSMKQQTRDDYLLGGRSMHPWLVGLSYFATIFSTVTYLSWPGEIVRYGPMMLAQLAGFPLAIGIVNYFIIPHFMGLNVTSAYEVLEMRLGLSIRMLGSALFLLMRLCWMAVIIHTTTVEILIPVAGFDSSLAPFLSLAICFSTIVYTAMGGFRAVVITDVAQTLILFGATIAALIAVTCTYGGLGWFPTRWEPHWQRPVFGYDSSVRVTFLGAIISMATWHVCTAGSDQMAIQRYLATRDVKAARRMFTVALASNCGVCLCLAALGLSLVAYFRLKPEMLNLGQSIEQDSDQFFQHFIAVAMAPGVCGLVVAGLLSAAMDSLSSGINSSSSVVTVDFIERFRKQDVDRSATTARWLSWVIGTLVVVLSTLVGFVSGNLLEVTFKVVNLLTAPLFGMFFMALFVRSATPFGTWCGALAGMAAAVLVNYGREILGITLAGFIWAMPISLTIQLAVGCIASLIPIGPNAKPLIARTS